MKQKEITEAWCELLDSCVASIADILQYIEWLYDKPEITSSDVNKMNTRRAALEQTAEVIFTNNQKYLSACERKKLHENVNQLKV